MNKKKLNIFVIVSVILVLGIVISIKELTKKNTDFTEQNRSLFSTNRTTDIYKKYEEIKTGKKAGLIIISYKGECCPSAKEFFSKYNSSATNVITKFTNKINSLFIDIGTLNDTQKQELTKIAQETKAYRLPSLIVLDKKGEIKKVVIGPFQQNEIENLITGLINAG